MQPGGEQTLDQMQTSLRRRVHFSLGRRKCSMMDIKSAQASLVGGMKLVRNMII